MYRNPISYVTGVFSLQDKVLDPGESSAVAGCLLAKADALVAAVMKGLTTAGATEVEPHSTERPKMENVLVTDRNGPHVILPSIDYMVDGIHFRSRSRINVCKERHHSKVFFRSEPEFSSSQNVSKADLQALFLSMSRVGASAVNELAKDYERILAETIESASLKSYYHFETHAADADREEFVRKLTDCFAEEDTEPDAAKLAESMPEKEAIGGLLEAITDQSAELFSRNPQDKWLSVDAGYRRGLMLRRLTDHGLALVGLCGLDPEVRPLSHSSAPTAARIVAAQAAGRVAAAL